MPKTCNQLNIKQGTRIIQYIGEKISRQESNRRITAGNPYIFTFNDRWDIDGKDLRVVFQTWI